MQRLRGMRQAGSSESEYSPNDVGPPASDTSHDGDIHARYTDNEGKPQRGR